jgi:hypothetical protein
MMNRKAMSLAVLLVVLVVGSVWSDDQYSYFYIKDMAHGQYLSAGHKYDGNIYHLTEEETKVVKGAALWRFEEAGTFGGTKYYYIVDRQHGAALSAGHNKDNNTYSIKDYEGRDNCKWKATEQDVENGLISFVFTDRKHELDLVAGDVYDRDVYHQKAGTRPNGRWFLEMAMKRTKGPDFCVVEQRLIALDFHDDKATVLDRNPLLTIAGQRIPNNTDIKQSFEIVKSQKEEIEEKWWFQHAVSASIFQTVSFSGGLPGGVEAKSETTIGFVYEHEWGESNTRTVSNELTWSVPVAVPPHSIVEVNGVIIRLKRDVPFTAKIENTLGNGRKKIIYVDGIWTGVEYVSGDITFDQVE